MAESRGDHGVGSLQDLQARGDVETRSPDIPDTLQLDVLASMCDKEEKFLRLQYIDQPEFPPEWELGLANASRQNSSMTGALSRWGYILHVNRVRNQKLLKATEDPGLRNVVRDMVTREPVVVELPSIGPVDVTGRSYNAMLEMACHYLRIRDLDTVVRRLTVVEARATEDAERAESRSERRAARRRLRAYLRTHKRCLYEVVLQRRALWAHAFTPDGTPAESYHDSPPWFAQITPEDDALLLTGLFRVGPERIRVIQDANAKADDTDGGMGYGYHSLLATVEANVLSVAKPASLYDSDLSQLVGWLEAVDQAKPDEDSDSKRYEQTPGKGWKRTR